MIAADVAPCRIGLRVMTPLVLHFLTQADAQNEKDFLEFQCQGLSQIPNWINH
jgi:hypothetical protein